MSKLKEQMILSLEYRSKLGWIKLNAKYEQIKFLHCFIQGNKLTNLEVTRYEYSCSAV